MKIKCIRKDFYSIEDEVVRCFLVIGDKEALLIDAGREKGIREQVIEMTDLPVKVILTHGDLDHIASMGEFENVYAHPAELGFKRLDGVLPLSEKQVVVGDFQFEIISIPGHTPGSIALLEKNQHFLVGGDSISEATIYMFGEGRNLSLWKKSLELLAARKDEFEVIYASHGPLEVHPDQIDECCLLIDETQGGRLFGGSAPEKFACEVRVYATQKASMYYIKE